MYVILLTIKNSGFLKLFNCALEGHRHEEKDVLQYEG